MSNPKTVSTNTDEIMNLEEENQEEINESKIEGSGNGSNQLVSISSSNSEIKHSSDSSIKGVIANKNKSNSFINSSNSNSNKFNSNSNSNSNKNNSNSINGIPPVIINNSNSSSSNSDKINNNNKKEQISKINEDIVGEEDLFEIKKVNNQQDRNELKDEIKNEVTKKIEEGYFPLFIQLENNERIYYYAKKNAKFKKISKHYLKSIKHNKNIKVNFYYKEKKIEPNTIIKDLKMEPLCIVYGKEEF